MVKDNTLKGKTSNIYISKSHLNEPLMITIDGPMTEGASLGVSKKETPAAGVNVDVTDVCRGELQQIFFSDNSDYYVVYNAGKKVGEVTRPHTHCVCGGATVSGDHTGESHEDIFYQSWDGSTTALSEGNYYLSKDIALEQAVTTTGNSQPLLERAQY